MIMHLTQKPIKRIVFHMREEPKGGSRIGYWIVFILLILIAAYIFFRR